MFENELVGKQHVNLVATMQAKEVDFEADGQADRNRP